MQPGLLVHIATTVIAERISAFSPLFPFYCCGSSHLIKKQKTKQKRTLMQLLLFESRYQTPPSPSPQKKKNKESHRASSPSSSRSSFSALGFSHRTPSVHQISTKTNKQQLSCGVRKKKKKEWPQRASSTLPWTLTYPSLSMASLTRRARLPAQSSSLHYHHVHGSKLNDA